MEKKLSILFLDTKPVRRGAQVFIHELKKQFEISGLTVHRIFLYRENQFENLVLFKNDDVLDFNEYNWKEKWLFFQPILFFELFRKVNQLNPDVILCNGSRTLKYASLVKIFSKRLNNYWIYRVIDSARYWNNKKFTALIYKYFIIPKMDASVGVSNKSLMEMKKHYGFKKQSVAIPRAVDIPYFINYIPEIDLRSKWKIDKKAFVILFLGNFTQQKRPDRFLKILDGLKSEHPHIHGLMVGDGPLKNEIIAQSKKLKIENQLTLAGYQKDVRPFIAMSNLLVLTSDTEGMPGVVLEAAAMKKVSVCANVGGIREFIENDEIGFVLDDFSERNFITKINGLILNELLLAKTSENAFFKVCESYDLSVISNQYLVFFNNLSTAKNNFGG